ncbi:uncharacterized protein LOC124491501 [Dermatophagoides farinae]|uniref:Uncharacterized protein n=1 Tax=Dermatophagoides farinae TaxID=6954 RepID=A0A922I5G1_DERFA|nr:uncharacterized protein LOC124491501 isoform X2 [Dermatophagoides farinae]XP_046910106.1 uncharacterized protein LOC124491501 isoform X2 [Dermatophagoides farinae]KAH7641705.1 hypothetical protein HUG17_4750 [Dermatophagoides farinae]KAH9518311.1 hypothetical protein DERF_008901 [Dermatophagoides farinae]
MIMENNNRQQSQSIPIKFFAIQLLILLIIAVQTNGSQKFVPNGRYGRRSDLPPLSSINNNPSSSYDINRFVSSLTDADAMAMNQDAENMLLMMTMNGPQSVMNNNNLNWSASSNLAKQLWWLCAMNEDKIIMNRCLRSIPMIKMVLMKAAATDHSLMSEIDTQPQILQQPLKQQRQGQDQDRQ